MKITGLKIKDKWGKEELYRPDGRNSGVEVIWTYNNTVITKSVNSEGNNLIPCINDSREEVLIVFGSLKDIPPPAEAAVFNADGSVRFIIPTPPLVSEAYLKYEKEVGKERALKSISIVQPAIRKVGDKNIVTLWIGFSYDWFEVRELDLKTGKFGKCFGASRL